MGWIGGATAHQSKMSLLMLLGAASEAHSCSLLARRLSSIAASSSAQAAGGPSVMAAARHMATSEARAASSLSEPSSPLPSKPSFVPSWLKSLLPGAAEKDLANRASDQGYAQL